MNFRPLTLTAFPDFRQALTFVNQVGELAEDRGTIRT